MSRLPGDRDPVMIFGLRSGDTRLRTISNRRTYNLADAERFWADRDIDLS